MEHFSCSWVSNPVCNFKININRNVALRIVGDVRGKTVVRLINIRRFRSRLRHRVTSVLRLLVKTIAEHVVIESRFNFQIPFTSNLLHNNQSI